MSTPPHRIRSRYFTPAEADALLPELAAHMAHVAELARRHRELRNRLRAGVPDEGERIALARDATEARDLAQQVLEDMAEAGVEVKGIEPARLDFPALLRGQEVLLCWREGERAVRHWHGLHGTAASRQKVQEPHAGAWEWCH